MKRVRKSDKPPVRRLATSRDTRIREAMLALLVEGSSRKASKATGIPWRTIAHWAASAEGKRVMEEVKGQEQGKRADGLSKLLDKIHAKYEAALDAGEIAPRDLPIHYGIFSDKLARLVGKPDPTAGGNITVEVIFGGQRVPPTIEGEVIPSDDDEADGDK